jgi:hypothetical protein
MTNLNPKLLSRIQKLLALADPERNDSQAQIEAALNKVGELLQQHSITMQDVEGYEPEKELVCEVVQLWKLPNEGTLLERKHNQWLIDLGDGIGYANYCNTFHSWSATTYIGRKQDVQIASFMLENLFQRLIALSHQEMKQYMADYKEQHGKSAWHTWGHRHPKVWRRSWLEGAASALESRLCKPRQDAYWKAYRSQDENSTAIISLHNDALRKFTQEQFPKLKSLGNNQIAQSGGHGWSAGHKVGKEIEIQQGIDKARGTETPRLE